MINNIIRRTSAPRQSIPKSQNPANLNFTSQSNMKDYWSLACLHATLSLLSLRNLLRCNTIFAAFYLIPTAVWRIYCSKSIAYKPLMSKPISSPTRQYHTNLNKFNYSSFSTTALAELVSSEFTIRSLEISSNGKTGVIFIETDDGAFVLKSSNDGPKDEFLNRLAMVLNIQVPQSICYCCSDTLFHKLVFEIEKFCEKDEILYTRMKTRLDFPFYQIMEYIPSISLAEIGRERFEKYLLSDVKLYSLGMCMGFDLLINNSDRFKLIWTSQGNIGNVLVEIKDHDIHIQHQLKSRSNLNAVLEGYVYIDHSGYLLDLQNKMALQNFERYMGKVGDFHVKLIRALSEEKGLPEEFQKFKKQFEFFTHYVFTDKDLRKISHGIIYVTNKFLRTYQSNTIDQLYQNLKKDQILDPKKRKQKESLYWNQYWNLELKKVNLGYLQEVYTKLAAIYSTYPQTIDKIINEMGKQVEDQARNPEFDPTIHDSNLRLSEPKPTSKRASSVLPPNNPNQQHEPTIPEEKPQPQEEHNSKHNSSHQSQVNKQLIKADKERKWRDRLAKFKQENSKG